MYRAFHGYIFSYHRGYAIRCYGVTAGRGTTTWGDIKRSCGGTCLIARKYLVNSEEAE